MTTEAFRRELVSLVNKHSVENGSDTADIILADYLIACLEAFETATVERERFLAHPLVGAWHETTVKS